MAAADGVGPRTAHGGACCGQPAWNAGFTAAARRVAGATLRALRRTRRADRRPVRLLRHDDAAALAGRLRRHVPRGRGPRCRRAGGRAGHLPRRPVAARRGPVARGDDRHRATTAATACGSSASRRSRGGCWPSRASRWSRARAPSAAAASAARSASSSPRCRRPWPTTGSTSATAAGVADRRRRRPVLPRAPEGRARRRGRLPLRSATSPRSPRPSGDASATRDRDRRPDAGHVRSAAPSGDLRDDRLAGGGAQRRGPDGGRAGCDALAGLEDPDGLRDAARALRADVIADLPDAPRRVRRPVRGQRRPRALGRRRRRRHRHVARPRRRAAAPAPSSRASRWPPRRSTSTTRSRPPGWRWSRPTSASGSSSSPARRPRTSSPRPSTTTATPCADIFAADGGHARRGRHRAPRPPSPGPAARRASCAPTSASPACNFAVAETGSIVLVENEGNGRLCTSRAHGPHRGHGHGADRAETGTELDLLLNLLARSATGQRAVRLHQHHHRPPPAGRGRRARRAPRRHPRQRPLPHPAAASSRRCCTASAAAPASTSAPSTARSAATPTAGSTPGPIGAVLTPLLARSDPAAAELADASTLCGACMEACPVAIPLQDLLLQLRQRDAGTDAGRARRLGFTGWSWLWSTRAGFTASDAARPAGPSPGPRPDAAARLGRQVGRGPGAPVTTKEVFLRRLRTAAGPGAPPPHRPLAPVDRPPEVRPVWPDAAAPMTDRWVRSFEGLGGHVHRTTAGAGRRHHRRGRRRPGPGPGRRAGPAPTRHRRCRRRRPGAWCGRAAGWAQAATAVSGVVEATAAIASTGSVVVDSDRNGRLVSLLPRVAVFVLSVADIVPATGDLLRHRDEHWPDGPPTNVVLVTGPSRLR